jgi:hypothetical protein
MPVVSLTEKIKAAAEARKQAEVEAKKAKKQAADKAYREKKKAEKSKTKES